jgi:hypothetical protein
MGITCAWICVEHETEERQIRALLSAEEKVCMGTDSCCPMAKLPDAALCDRTSAKPKTCNAGQTNVLLTLSLSNQIKEFTFFTTTQVASLPPCQRASVLRI